MCGYRFALLLYSLCFSVAFAQIDTTKNVLFRFGTNEMLALPSSVSDVQVTTSAKNAESLRDATASITVVSAYEIEGYGALNFPDVLDRVVGTYITGSYTLTNNIVSVRSDVTITHNTHILVLMNGRPMRENMYHGFNTAIYYGLPISAIDHIEIVRGPGSVLYGSSAFAGVVNIILKEGRKQTSQASQTLGTFGTRMTELSMGFAKEALKVSVALKSLAATGWQFKTLGVNKVPINEFATSHALGSAVNIGYKNFTFTNFVGVDRREKFAKPGYSVHAQYRRVRNTRIFNNLGYRANISSKTTLDVDITHNNSEYYEDMSYPDSITTKRLPRYVSNANDILGEVTLQYAPKKNINILVGGLVNTFQGKFIKTYQNSNGSAYSFRQNPTNNDPFKVIDPYSDAWFSGYAQGAWQLFNEKFKIVAGAQYNTTNNKQSIVPRLGVVYHVSKKFTTKIMYGEAFRNGSSYERFSREDESYGNSSLNPETIKTLEANVMYNALNKKTYLSLTGYYSQTVNTITISDAKDNLFIDPITQKSYPIYINSKNFTYYGLELEGSHNFTDRLQTHLSFTIRDVTQPIAEGTQIQHQATGIPNFMGKIGLLYRNKQKGLQGGAFYSYIGQTQPLNRYSVKGNIQTFQDLNPNTDAYHYLTLNIEADIKEIFNIDNSPAIIFSLFIQNALNAKVFHPDYKHSAINSVPGRSGRGVYGRLAVRF